MWTTLHEDVFPPLYYLLLRGVRCVFGPSDAAARGLSVAASLGAIVMLFVVGRRLHGAGPALWACLIMALATPQIQYAQEARCYAVVLFLGLACIWALLRLEDDAAGPRLGHGVVLAICALGAMLTHYYAAGPLAGLAIYAAIEFRGRARKRAVLAFAAAGLVFMVIWGPFLWKQLHMTISSSDWSLEPRQGHLLRTLVRLGVLPYLALGPPLPGPVGGAAISGVIFILPFILARKRPDLLLWGLWMAGGVGLVLAFDLRRSGLQLQMIRYALLATPGVYMVIAAILWDRDAIAPSPVARWLRHALPLLAVSACLITAPEAYAPAKPDWRRLAELISRHQKPGDVYVFAYLDGGRQAVSQTGIYYDGITHYTGDLAGPAMVLLGPATPAQLAELSAASRGGGIWVYAGPRVDSPEKVLPAAHADRSLYELGLGYVWHVKLGPFTSTLPTAR